MARSARVPIRNSTSRSGPWYAPSWAMSGIWTGSRVTAIRPATPSPRRIGVRRAVATTSSSRLWVAQVELLGPLVVLVDGARVGPGELTGARDDRVEHGLEVESGAEGLADLAECLKLMDRAGELSRAGLQLAEQPRVLDGDGRLVGEGLHQGDLTVGEWADLVSIDQDHS